MSDAANLALLQERINQDERLRAIQLDIELATSPLVTVILEALAHDTQRAIHDLLNLSPTDSDGVAGVMVRLRAGIFLKTLISRIRESAGVAQVAILEEETALRGLNDARY